MKIRTLAGALLAATAVPVVLSAPRPAGSGATVDSLVAGSAGTGREGRELVDDAIARVAEAFPCFSLRHLWESPERALAGGRGWSHQYNTVLFKVLRGLGFEVRSVHAARVRGFGRPWWLAGHAWVKVLVDGRWLDACASLPTNRVGEPPFVALTPELPLRRVTRWAVGLALFPFVAAEVWRSWLRGRSVPGHLYARRHR